MWKNFLAKINPFLKMPRWPFLWLIRLYQKTLSPDHGFVKILFPYGYCKFQPSCSEYGYQAIAQWGIFRGIPLAIWRILRCNPCSKGGLDQLKIDS